MMVQCFPIEYNFALNSDCSMTSVVIDMKHV